MTYDVAIIGGGLSGCAAAIRLAERGHHVLVLEAGSYPRHKVCGEFLSPECASLFESLGVTEAVYAYRPATIDQTRITAPDGAVWESSLPAPGIGLSRYALDDLLVRRARDLSAEVRTNTRVRDVTGTHADGFTLDLSNGKTEQARVVIAAYGRRANLDHTLKRPFLKREHPYVGLKMHFRGPAIPRRVDLHTFRGGYCGLSEIEDGWINACLLVRQPVLKAAGSVDDFVGWMRSQNPALETWMADAEPRFDRWLSIAQIPFVHKSPVEGDILMTGDAAGLIAPLAGDGMGMALEGGIMAADHAHALLRGETAPYAAAWQRKFGFRLPLSYLLQTCMLHPSLVSPGLRLLSGMPSLGRFFIAHTRSNPHGAIAHE